MKSKLFLSLTLLLLAAFAARATTRAWNGGGLDNLWTNAANWHGLAPVSGDDIVFPGAPADSLINTNNFPANTIFSSITISGTNYSLSGNSIILTNGISHASGGTNSLGLFLQLNASQRFEATVANGELDVSGNINLNGNNLTNDTTGRINLEGEISGTGNLVKTGAGTLKLFGDSPNIYAGSMKVNNGILELGKGFNSITGILGIGDGVGALDSAIVRFLFRNQISDSSAVTIEDDGLLDLNDNEDLIGSLTMTGGDVATGGTGILTLGGDVTAHSSAFQATISGNLSLGSATRTFSIDNGSANPELTISAVISGDAGVGITKTGGPSGSATLLLSGANTYSGVTTIALGVLNVSNPSALGSTTSGTILSGDSALVLNNVKVVGESLTNTDILSALASVGESGWAGNVVLNATLEIQVNAGTNNISGVISGAGGLSKISPGPLILSGTNNNTYAGTTTVSTGTLLLNKSPGVTAIPGSLVIGDGVGGANADVIRLQANSQISDSSTITIASSGLLDTDGFTEVVGAISGAGNLQLDGSIFSVGFNGSTAVFGGTISGSSNLIKNGNGTWILDGTNNFSGVFQMNGGITLVNGIMPANPTTVLGTLGGTGTVGRVTMSGAGTISPGNSPGRLTTSNFTFIVSSKFNVEINDTTPGSGYDQLKVNGTINNLASATLNATLGFPSAISNSFIIIDNDGSDAVTNTFFGLAEGATVDVSGTPFRISYVGGSGNDVVLTQLTATQLPTLNIQKSANTNVVLSWAKNFTGYTLESNTNLFTTVWEPLNVTPTVMGTNNFVTNGILGAQTYYRLRAP